MVLENEYSKTFKIVWFREFDIEQFELELVKIGVMK